MNKERKIKDNLREEEIDTSNQYVSLDAKGLFHYNMELLKTSVIILEDSLDNFKGNSLYLHCMCERIKEMMESIFEIDTLLRKTAHEKEITEDSWKECMRIFNKGE